MNFDAFFNMVASTSPETIYIFIAELITLALNNPVIIFGGIIVFIFFYRTANNNDSKERYFEALFELKRVYDEKLKTSIRQSLDIVEIIANKKTQIILLEYLENPSKCPSYVSSDDKCERCLNTSQEDSICIFNKDAILADKKKEVKCQLKIYSSALSLSITKTLAPFIFEKLNLKEFLNISESDLKIHVDTTAKSILNLSRKELDLEKSYIPCLSEIEELRFSLKDAIDIYREITIEYMTLELEHSTEKEEINKNYINQTKFSVPFANQILALIKALKFFNKK